MTKSTNRFRLADYSVIPEGLLSFDPVNTNATDSHPLRGLLNHGPFGAKQAPLLVRSPIRAALITVEGHGVRIRDHLNRLLTPIKGRDKSGYFPDYPGFEQVFQTTLDLPQGRDDRVVLLPRIDLETALASTEPELLVLGLFEGALRRLNQRRASFDVLVVYLPPWMASVFRIHRDEHDFDLHHALKASTAQLGIPSQIILDRSIEYSDTTSVLWSLATALYAKVGGIPWRLAASSPRTAFVGLSYVLMQTDERRRVLTCCSQLFDDSGHGLRFLLFTADEFVERGHNPFLTRASMRRLLAKTLELYVRQIGGLPEQLVVHKTTHFTKEEREGASEALGALDAFELLQVQEDTPWNAVKGRSGNATPYPVDRGTILPISKFSYLLWTGGDAVGISQAGKSYFQEGKGIPAPLLITQHAGSTPAVNSAAQILGLTKMNWNTSRLYNGLPITIKSATTLGQIAKYMSRLAPLPYEFRLFM